MNILNEKSYSKTQQRLFGYAYAIKKEGEDSDKYKEAPDEVKKLADSMSLKKLKDYASTKHKGLPEKKKKDKIKESHILSFSRWALLK
jgi:hypothetical protein